MSAEGLRVYARMTYGVEFTKEEAEKHRGTFFRLYPGLARWHQETRRRRAGATHSASGRRRLLHSYTPDTERLNSPVQGEESDLAKTAMSLLWERRHECPGAHPVLFCHDEIVVEAPVATAEAAAVWLKSAMEDGAIPILYPVPVKVDCKIVSTWGD